MSSGARGAEREDRLNGGKMGGAQGKIRGRVGALTVASVEEIERARHCTQKKTCRAELAERRVRTKKCGSGANAFRRPAARKRDV